MRKPKHSDQTLLWLVAIGFFMETLDATIVNTALPTMAHALNVEAIAMQSVIISYSLTLAILIPASGWLSDKFGIRKVYTCAIFIFTLGSLFCAISNTLQYLVFSRILQAIGGSMLIPVGRLSLLKHFPGHEYLKALSFVAVPALIGPLLGPTLGGWLVEFASWHWIFLINIPIGIIGIFTTLTYMPKEDPPEEIKPFDLIGFLQISFFMLAISLALEGVDEFGFSQAVILLLICFGFASLASYFFHAAKKNAPLLSPSVFKIRTFRIGILGNIFSRIGNGGLPFLIPLFLQLCLEHTPFEAGLAMLPLAIAAILAKKIIAPILLHFGYKKFLITNTFLIGIGIASFALLEKDGTEWMKFMLLFCFGIFNSMQFTAMNTLTMKDLGSLHSNTGNTIYSMVQMLAMTFSVSAVSVVLKALMQYFPKLAAFHYTFITMGILTMASALIFWQLRNDERINPPPLQAGPGTEA